MLRELFVKIGLESNAEDRIQRLNTELDRASQEFKKLGARGDNSLKTMVDGFYELGRAAMGNESSKELQVMARAAGMSEKAVDRLVQKTREDMKLDEQFREAAKAAGLTDAEIHKIKGSIDKAKESTASWKNLFSGLASVGITAMAGMFVGSGVKMAAQTENMTIQFETLMGDAELAKKTLASLKDFSTSTNFESDQVTKAGRQLLAVKVSADELIPSLKMIGDIANGSGKDFNELATIFAKNKSSNFIQGEDLNQLIEAGIPILDEFSKMFGKTAIQVKEMGSKNQIEFKHLQEAFKNMTSETGIYSNMTEKLSKTSLGMWSTLNDKIKDVGKSFGTAILSVARPVLEFFTQGEQSGMRLNMALGSLALVIGVALVSALRVWIATSSEATLASLRMWGAMLGPAILVAAKLAALYLILEDIWVFFEYGPDASETYFADILGWLGYTDSELRELFQSFKLVKTAVVDFWENIKLAFQNETFRSILKYTLLIVGALILWKVLLVGAIIYGIILLVDNWQWLVQKMKSGWEWLVDFLKKSALVLGKILIMAIFPLSALYFFREEIKNVFQSIGNYISNLPFVQNFINQFMSLKDRISSVFSGMWQSLAATFKSLLPTETINTIIDGMNWISAKLNEFSSGKIAAGLGISPLNLPVIPRIEPRALGGPINAGEPYLVGERGPELVVPRNNGTVIPNDKLQAGSGNSPIIFNATFNISGGNAKEQAVDIWETLKQLAKDNSNEVRVQLGLRPV